jgi:inorganic pyrophosphatase
VHYLHIPALERTKIPDETNQTPMIRVLTIHSDGLVVVNTYEVGVNEAPIAKYEYGFSIDPGLWNGAQPAKDPMQLDSRNRSDNICSTATRIDSVTVQLAKDFSKQKAKASADLVNTLIEIPTGTLEKWELNKNNPMQIIWERKNGVLRQVQYLGYPGNYGAIPSTNMALEQGGDGDALDVLVLGAALARGSWHTVRPIGILYMQDDGEQDDKIIAVDPNSPPFGAVQSLKQLDSLFVGSTTIISTWFKNYKGPQTSVQIKGMGGSTQAWEVINARLMASNNKEI